MDSLITSFRLPDQTLEHRAKIREKLRKAIANYRGQIERSSPDDQGAELMNQFAWLVGNTEGDLDEALRYSKRSLELKPNTGAYLDTLAHVYFARGDYDSAIRNQTVAAERDPHSGLIAQELTRFRAVAAEHKKAKGHAGPKP